VRRASELTFAIKQRLVADESAAALRSFETFFYDWLKRTEPGLLKEINNPAALSPGLRDALARAVHEAKREFGGGAVAEPAHESYREDGGES
jgi:hypothetical protein